MAKRVQPQTDPGNSSYNYGYRPSGGGGARRVQNTGNFGPDVNYISERGQSSFAKMYKKIQDASDKENRNQEKPKTEKANVFDQAMSDIYDLGEQISSPQFVRDLQESESPVDNAFGFVVGLPFGTIGAIPQGIAQGYEAISGRGVSGDDHDRDTVENLDSNQRAASAVNAGINLVGSAFGGSGRMLKGGYRTARTLLGDVAEEGAKKAAQKAAKDVGEGFIKGGGWKDVVGDMGEEAGEEFIQSLADDARYGTSDEGSFGRAIESAAWGALGGGIMSGAGYGLNKLATRIAGSDANDGNNNSKDPSVGRSDAKDVDAFTLQYGDQSEKNFVTSAVQEAYTNRVEGRSANWPGSRSATLMQSNDKNLGINESKMGTDGIRSIWLANDDGKSAKIIEDAFGMTHDEAVNMFQSQDWSQQLKSRFDAKRDNGEKVTFYWARNPATKGRQPVKVDLTELFDGDGLMLHPMVMSLVGADVDGDKTFATFSNEATENARYATSLLYDPETGQSAIDSENWARTGIGSHIDTNIAKRIIGDALAHISREYEDKNSGAKRTTTAYGSVISGLNNSNDSFDATMSDISDALSKGEYDVVGDKIAMIGDIAASSGFDQDVIIQEIVRSLATDNASSLAASIDIIVENVGQAPDFKVSDSAPAAGIRGSGSTPADFSYSQYLVNWNELTYAIVGAKGNPPFRQFGENGYRGKSAPNYIATAENIDRRIVDITDENFNSNDKLNNFLVACLKETARGMDVENSIETKLQAYVKSRVMQNTKLRSNRISTIDDLKTVMREFVDARNQAREWSKEARRRLTNLGWSTDTNTPMMRTLTYTDDITNNMDTMSEFLRIFGDSDPSEIFDTHAFPESVDGMTVNEIVDSIARSQYSSGTELIAAGRDISTIFDSLVKVKNHNRVIVSHSLRNQITDLTKQLAIISERASNGTINNSDMAAASFILNAINEIVGGDESLEIGIYDPTTFLRSRWGQEIASGDSKRATRAIISMSLAGQFRRVQRMFKQAIESGNQFQINYAISQANELARIDGLHEAIASQMISGNGESGLLNYLIDLDNSYDQITSEFASMFETDGGKNDLLLMSLTDKVSEFDMTDINARRKKATTSYNSGLKASHDNAVNDVNQLRNILSTHQITEQILCNAIEDAVSTCYTDMDNAALAMMIIDADNFGNSSLEKATIEYAPQFYGNGVEVLTNGGISSEIDHAINEPALRMSIQQYTNNRRIMLGVLSGRIPYVYVYDPNDPGSKDTIVNRDRYFKEAIDGWRDGSTPTANDWLALLTEYPQIATIIAPNEIQQRLMNGSPNTSIGQSETLSSYVESYSKIYNVTGPDYESMMWRENAKRHIRNEIRRIPNLASYVASLIPDLDMKIRDPKSLQAACDEVMNNIVDAAFDKAMIHETGDDMQSLRGDESTALLNGVLSDISSSISNAQLLSMSLDVSENVRSTLEKMMRLGASDSMYVMLANSLISDETNAEHSLLGDIDISDSYNETFKKDLDEIKDGVANQTTQYIHQMLGIYKIILEFTDSTAFDANFNPSDELRNKIFKSIDNISDLTPDQKSRIKSQLGTMSETLGNVLADIALDGIVTDIDVNPAISGKSPDIMKAELKAKARKIWSNSQNRYPKEIDNEIDNVIDGAVSGASIAEARRELKIKLDSEYLSNYLRDMKQSTGIETNQNALRLYTDSMNIQRDIERSARSALNGMSSYVPGTTESDPNHKVKPFPVPHILNPRTQAIITKLNSTDVPAGVVPTRVGVNGSNFRNDAGFAVLPRNEICDSGARMITSADLSAMAANGKIDLSTIKFAKHRGKPDPNWVYNKDTQGKEWTLSTFTPEMVENILSGTYPPDQTWWVFIPDDCDNGLCVAHQQTPVGVQTKGYLSVPNIINRINQYAQEAMNLKAKKKAVSTSILGHETFDVIASRDSLDLSKGVDIDAMNSQFKKIRDKVSRHLNKWLTSDLMADLGYGRHQAEQLSLVMVQGLRITIKMSNGTTFERIIPKRSFSSQAAFDLWLEGIRKSIGDDAAIPVMTQEHIMTIDELSSMAMLNVVKNYESDMSADDISRYAYEGMTNLDAIRPGSLDFDEIMSNVSPVGMAFGNIVQSSTSPSISSAYLDIMSGNPNHALRHALSMRGMTQATTDQQNAIDSLNRKWRNSNSGFNNYPDSKIAFAIPASNFHDRYNKQTDRGISDLYDDAISSLSGIPENVRAMDGMAIAFDSSGVKTALNWARSHRQPFAIPRKIYDEIGLMSETFGKIARLKTIKSNDKVVELVVFDPSATEDLEYIYTEQRATSKNHAEINNVMAVMQSTPGMSMADAGSLINANTAGWITTEHNSIEGGTADHYLANGVRGITRLADASDIRRIAKDISNGDLTNINLNYLSKTENISNEEIRILLNRFSQWAMNNEGKSVRSKARAGDVVAFMVTTSTRTGKPVYTPISLSRSGMQDEYGNIEVSKSGGTISIGYNSATSIADNLNGDGAPKLYCHKIAVNGVSFKSMGTPIEPGRFKEVAGSDMPAVRATINGEKQNVDIVIDSGAVKGRVEGKDQSNILNSMWYYTHGKCAINPFIEFDGNGNISLSNDLKELIYRDPTTYSRGFLVDLLSGSGSMTQAKKIANGTVSLSTDTYISNMLKNIFARAIEHHIYPMSLMSSAQLSEDLVNRLYPSEQQIKSKQFPTVDMKNGLVRRAPSIDYKMALGGMSIDDTLTFFHWMDKNICKDPRDPNAVDDGTTVFDMNGNTYVEVGTNPSTGEKMVSPQKIIWGPVLVLDKSSRKGTPSGTAKRGAQMRTSQAYDNGMSPTDTDFFAKWFAELVGRPEIIENARDANDLFPKTNKIAEDIGYTDDPDYLNQVISARFISRRQQLHWDKVKSAGDVYRNPIPFKDVDGKVIADPGALAKNRDVAISVSNLNKMLRGKGDGISRPLTIDEVLILYINSSGETRTESVPDKLPSIRQFTAFIDEMAENVSEYGIPIKARRTNIDDRNRYSLALLPREFAAELFAISPKIREMNNNSFDNFSEKMHEEQSSCISMIDSIKDKGKRNELYRLCDWTALNWGDDPATNHIYGEMYLSDMIETNDTILKACGNYMFTPEQIKWFTDNAKIQAQKIARIAAHNDTRTKTAVTAQGMRNNELVRYNQREYDGAEKFLRNVSEMSRFMAMLNPFIPAANILDRAIHQGTTNAAMAWCMNHGVGPYKSSFVPNQDIVNAGADSVEASKVFDMIRYASYDGDEARILSSINSMDDVNNYLSTREEFLKKEKLFFIPRTAVEKVFEFSGGGNVMAKYQRRNWFNQFARIIASDDFNRELNGQMNPLLTKPAGSNMTILEQQWMTNPDMLLISVFRNENNPYHSAALRALNFSRSGEATQANILSVIYSSLAKQHPAVEFFTTTCVSRFFLYSTNMTGRILNLVAPISSVNYLLNEFAARLDTEGRFNFEDIQMYTSFKEALLVDATHMAPAVLAMLLASITGLFQPPEDEDKRGNYDEWLIGGKRIGEDWMLKDILGLSGPLACFFTSVFNGETRFDLLWNGFLDCCYNNPIIKAGSVFNTLIDPESSFSVDYDEDAERYEDAPGGKPDMLSWLTGRGTAAFLSWGSQFMTPSIIREISNSIETQPYERSYRHVIATDSRGEPIINVETGMPEYQETSYLDAQIRRVSRTNPMIGLFMDVVSGAWVSGTTGYTAWEMPRTVYYDDAQLESMRLFSVNDEDGNPLPVDQQQEKIYMVISQLMAYDDMEELAATGFYLDYDTKMMVGDTIHDIIQTMRDEYSQMNADGFFDYYYGGLDYESGRARAETLKSQYYDELGFWQSLYYDKLWSEPLKRTLVQYNRYNTTYAQDANGEWYATGIYNSINPLFHNAPGDINDPGGTAGYGKDWRTVSAVTGQPMDQRALIPVEAGYLDTPDLDSLGDDSNGGFSQSFPGWNYANSIDGDGYSYGGGGWGWRSYGGYRRGGRGGGGGGGYSPNIYSRVPNVYPNGARVMYSERIYDPNYDYLRPNFETKGSREAYKRSDI